MHSCIFVYMCMILPTFLKLGQFSISPILKPGHYANACPNPASGFGNGAAGASIAARSYDGGGGGSAGSSYARGSATGQPPSNGQFSLSSGIACFKCNKVWSLMLSSISCYSLTCLKYPAPTQIHVLILF